VGAQELEEATAATLPWSGWWWPAKAGQHILGYRNEPGAMIKLDLLNRRGAGEWEKSHRYHFSLDADPWWGHCHGWAAASILEPEPLRDVLHGGIWFRIGDLKALLAESHYSDRAQFFGQRFDGKPGQDPQDMSPLLVWQVLRRFIYENKQSIVFDLDAGTEVWSFPVYRYRVLSVLQGDGSNVGSLMIWHPALKVHPDRTGTVAEVRTYTFVYRVGSNKQPIPGSDRWTGLSVADHPDFAWYPLERAQQNPNLDYDLTLQLCRKAR
jgi:hypothetical protein